jgi:putative ABC transport system permease protein
MLFVLHEHSYDGWHVNAGRIFSVGATLKMGDGSFRTEGVSSSTGPLVKQADGHIESFLRVLVFEAQIKVQDPAKPEVYFTEKGALQYADSNYFQFFSFKLLTGNPAHVLDRPFTLVLTSDAAKKYFGTTDAVGRRLKLDGQYIFEVTGIAADLPSNTERRCELTASFSSMNRMDGLYDGNPQMVSGGFTSTWLLLTNAGGAVQVEGTLDRLGTRVGQPEKDQDHYQLLVLSRHHLDAEFGDSAGRRYLAIFPLVAALILLLAVINYTSLATARAAVRAKEVGVRKVLGAGRGQIVRQFYIESTVLSTIAMVGGLLLFLLCKPFFFGLLRVHIDNRFLLSAPMVAGACGLYLFVIFLAGGYPSVVLSAFKPVAVLYGKLSRQRGGERVRKGFLVFQFAMALVLVIGSLVITKELHFIRNTDTGVDRENVVMVPIEQNFKHYPAFKREVEAIPGISQVATSRYALYKGMNFTAMEAPGVDKTVSVNCISADTGFVRMFGLRWKPQTRDGDHYKGGLMLLNETAVKELGLSGDPVGQVLTSFGKAHRVGGVVSDFNYESLHDPIRPLALFLTADTASEWQGAGGSICLLAKINAHVNLPTVLGAIKKIYAGYDNRIAFEYSFADDAFDAQYKAEDRLAGLFGVFTGITVVIACLGLFALATFSAQQRVKEIGIRKVLGASVGSIGALLSKDFLRPVLLAVVIACPLSWWLMNKWLDDFAYRTALSWWVFAAAGLGLLLVALGTVLSRSLRAGRANPVENLRTE